MWASLTRRSQATTASWPCAAIDQRLEQSCDCADGARPPRRGCRSSDRALAIDPRAVPARLSRGNALERLGRYEAALADYDRILAIEPKFADALNNRGSALDRLGRHSEALAGYEAAVAAIPSSPMHTAIWRAR